MNAKQSLIKVLVGGVPVPVADVVVCPLTGQLLLRSEASAIKFGLEAEVYVARQIAAPKDDAVPARPATMVHPSEVDPKTLR